MTEEGKGKARHVGGKIKEEAGELLGDREMEREGRLDQKEGRAEQREAKAEEEAREARKEQRESRTARERDL